MPHPIAIVSAGPSVSRTWPHANETAYALIIAVNAAMFRYRCDIGIALDPCVWGASPPPGFEPFAWRRHVGSIGVWSSQFLHPGEEPVSAMAGSGDIWEWQDIDKILPGHYTFSIEAALRYAARLAPSRIDLYGHDMGGIGINGHAYNRDLWEDQHERYHRLVPTLGVPVCRILPLDLEHA